MAYKATYRTRAYKPKGRSRPARTNPVPGLTHEHKLLGEGASTICGIDEVGVGAWAGPLAVGAVVLPNDKRIYKLRDSKLLDQQRRAWLADRVKQRCLAWSVGLSWPAEIDAVGLSEAQRRAASRAIGGLGFSPDAFLVDGQWNFVGERATTIVRGDCASVSIAAASIVAKVCRDNLMHSLSDAFPYYRFELNKGYPSPAHKWGLAAFGPSCIHRKLFAPIQRLIDEGTPGRLLGTRTI